MNESENIELLTGLFRTSDLPLWTRLRLVVNERGVEPSTSLLAVSFEDDANFEYGILVTDDQRVFQYGFAYTAPNGSDGVLTEWRDVTDSDLASSHHRSAAETALSLLAHRT